MSMAVGLTALAIAFAEQLWLAFATRQLPPSARDSSGFE